MDELTWHECKKICLTKFDLVLPQNDKSHNITWYYHRMINHTILLDTTTEWYITQYNLILPQNDKSHNITWYYHRMINHTI